MKASKVNCAQGGLSYMGFNKHLIPTARAALFYRWKGLQKGTGA